MALFPAPELPAQRLEILSGASRQVHLRGGATVVCVSGSLLVVEPPYRSEVPPGRHLPPPVRLNAGESYPLPEGGPLVLTALCRTQAICLDVPSPAQRFWAIARGVFRAVSKNNRQNGLGALHKISK
ncbi:hypothetical protein LMG3458_04780 [Achromobacter deleyi]|uniref:Uncharacterized protein n=1 Tax=Achromobacter deleyi TaxID=1353891 RepID=A0A6S7AFT6_9BURK|nr:hypothetical protein [Achromobacter deleyi]CAB3730284.1 hypothetical protein LMG3458_04780 [Achromobacter deleyi]CAB3839564.1 hypothetical protein LMG3412_01170 [Achromobacter deleyi]CAB3862463.1 hypothetical protein LMG3481_02327 [Achromobacter deleyi]CAB3904498.1 hypothetical protein LMG3482_04479 [Achromobacter deleyi]